jgi:hypothetical protein
MTPDVTPALHTEDAMGFNMVAKRRNAGREDFIRTSIFQMIFLRAAMVAAGFQASGHGALLS